MPHMQENWKIIPHTKNLYFASDLGRIKNSKGEMLKFFKITHGYLGCALYLPEKKQAICHRLIAETFLPNFSHRLQVNHIDLNKQNNIATNLEMVTPAENIRHFWKSKPSFECLRCSKKFISRSAIPNTCSLCGSQKWNVAPVKRYCRKCGHSWTNHSKNKTRQCKKCLTDNWEAPALAF